MSLNPQKLVAVVRSRYISYALLTQNVQPTNSVEQSPSEANTHSSEQ